MKPKVYAGLTLVFGVIFLGGGIFHRFHSPGRALAPDTETRLVQGLFPDADLAPEKTGPPPHYEVFRTRPGGKKRIGVAFLTTDIVPGVKGYGGPIGLLVGTDLKGNITGIRVLSSSENTSYTGPLELFLKQFTGRSPQSPLTLRRDIQGITGATVTSTAVTRAVRESLRIIAQRVLKTASAPATPAAGEAKPFPVAPAVIPVIVFALGLAGLLLRQQVLRWSALLLSLVYLGFMTRMMFSAVHIANLGLWNIPPFDVNPAWFLLTALVFSTVFLIGRLYCGSVCPFASVQEMLYNSFQKAFPGKSLRLSDRTDAALKLVKYAVLIVVTGVCLGIGQARPAEIEVFLTFFTRQAAPLAWVLLGLVLLVSLAHMRFWCKYLCPTGALLGLCARKSLYRVSLRPCLHCDKCADICPTQAIGRDENDEPTVNAAECVLCGRCLKSCPRGALRLLGKSHEPKR